MEDEDGERMRKGAVWNWTWLDQIKIIRAFFTRDCRALCWDNPDIDTSIAARRRVRCQGCNLIFLPPSPPFIPSVSPGALLAHNPSLKGLLCHTSRK